MSSYRVVMVAACPFPCMRGTPARIFKMAEAMSLRGHQVHVVTYHLGEVRESMPFSIYRTPVIKAYRRFEPGPTYTKLLILDPLLAFTLSRVLRRYPIDLIHAHHYEGLLISSLPQFGKRYPVVYDAHTLLNSELPYYRLGIPRKLLRWLGELGDRSLPHLATHVVSTTDRIRDALVHHTGIHPEDITVVPNGVETELFDRAASESASSHTSHKTLIYTGSLARYQQIELLLQAFNLIAAARADVQLRIVTNESFAPYRRHAEQLGIENRIDVYPGDFQSLVESLSGSDVALITRIECDGIPQKLLNYMAAGKPIVGFAGSCDLLKDGVTGLVVENGNIKGFARAVLSVLEDTSLANKLGLNARRYVTSQFTWEGVAKKLEGIYGVCVGAKSHQSNLAKGR